MFFSLRVAGLVFLVASAAMTDGEWRELEGPAWTMRYPPGYEKDARELDDLMRKTLDALTVEFAAKEPARLLKSVTCAIYVHGAPTSQAGVGLITLQTTFEGMDTFEAAAAEALGVDAGKFYARWARWIAARPPGSQP